MLSREEVEEIRVTATDPGGATATTQAEEVVKAVNRLDFEEEAENAVIVLTAYHLLQNVQGEYKDVGLAS